MQSNVHSICERSRRAFILSQVAALGRIVESYIEEKVPPIRRLRDVQVFALMDTCVDHLGALYCQLFRRALSHLRHIGYIGLIE